MRSPDWTWDELLLICSRVVSNDWGQLRSYQQPTRDLADLLRSLPLHGNAAHDVPEFRSAASISRKSADLITGRPDYTGPATRGGRLTRLVAEAFTERETEMLLAAQAIEDGISSGELVRIPEQPNEVDEDGVPAAEGRLLTRWATFRERNPALRKRKIAQARRLREPLQCSVCAFDFGRRYGTLGEGYIEVHHVLPLHLSGPRETRLEDLAFLCANCHRMCHRGHRGASWRTPADLRAEVEKAARAVGTA
ncbi:MULTISPECIES: HNH endonuclease [unclassified Streptomyces]|uniref:HNH endonuclease n=1 Tax=unclassified Streptomyces TaxID=2593676 RepID=UPI00081B475E|nr:MULTISPECIES: HNH endonuclease [unclassified Streptomyces]MYQ83917.1 HNH endonuclease [Streptomyces sp. SID4936]SCD76059.1 5-methylcytosine-specific restriction enzyme A [Streptomyces sp. DvalAA-43]